jgi:hypothetical protein
MYPSIHRSIYLSLQVLACVVDYAGVRAFVMAVPPVDDGHTLAQGRLSSHDTYVNRSAVLSSMLKRAAGHLNLKTHSIVAVDDSGRRGNIAIPMAVNVQGHLCPDNRFYVLELGKLFPPEPPVVGTADHLVRCLRPELVTRHNQPLSADAFCRSSLRTFDTAVSESVS